MLTSLLIRYLRPYKWQVVVIMIVLLAQAVANLYLPNLNADLINNGVTKGDVGYILRIGTYMLGSSGLVMIAAVIDIYVSSQVAMAFGRDLRRDVFIAVEGFSARELNSFGTPSLITRNTNDVQQVQMVLFVGLTVMISAPITGIGAVVLALRTNLHLSGLLAITIPLMSLVIFVLLRRVVPLFRLMQIRIDRINLVLREQFAGIRVIRAFVKRHDEEQRFNDANSDLMNTSQSVTRTFALMFPTLMLILNISSIAVIWIGGHLVNDGNLPIGDLTAFLAYLMQILMSVMMAVMMSLMIPRAATSAERIQAVLQMPSSVVDPTHPIEVSAPTGVIEFRHVSFQHPHADHPIIDDISFVATPGTVTAIVGGTGSGKSTLFNLASRFMDVTSGEVLIDGIDIRTQSLEAVWRSIGLVPQRAFLFGPTIAENLRYGDTDASDEALWEALAVAQSTEFVKAMSEGLNTLVAQGGTNLSGGQRQRIAIARALVKRPRIYLLDDSFSALDYRTDSRLRNALKDYAAQSTVIVIAQRISSVLDADQILIMNEGRLVGTGTHTQLMQDNETYREIVLSQISAEEAS